MPHEHLSLHLLHGLQSDAYHDDNGSAADGQRIIADQVAGDDGGDSHHGEVQAPNMVILLSTFWMNSLVGLPARKPGMNPPFFFRLFATSIGLNWIVE